jgi:hypothetical protein
MSTWSAAARNLRIPRFAEEAVERARLAVVPRQRTRPAPRVPFAILVGLVLLGGVAGLLLFNTHMQRNSFYETSLQTKADDLHAQEQALKMQLDVLRDPQTLADRAIHLGMVPPDSPAFLDLRTGRIIGNGDPSSGLNTFRVNPPAAAKPGSLRPAPIVLPRKVIVEHVAPARHGAAHQGTHKHAGTNRGQRD